jgi:hypothetical protein
MKAQAGGGLTAGAGIVVIGQSRCRSVNGEQHSPSSAQAASISCSPRVRSTSRVGVRGTLLSSMVEANSG